LDQRSKQLDVESAIGRDFKPEALDNMLTVLSSWSNQADLLLKTIKEKVNHANLMNETEKRHKEDFEKRLEMTKQNLKTLEESMLTQAELEGMDFYGEGERNRKGRSKLKMRDHAPHHGRDKRGV
jgi:DNA-binding transcriptional MerR regulator